MFDKLKNSTQKFNEDLQKTRKEGDYYLKNIKFDYPEGFKKIVKLGLVDFDSWYLFYSSFLEERYQGLKKRFPDRKLIPFARLDGDDDIACFEAGRGARVEIIHDFSDSRWLSPIEYRLKNDTITKSPSNNFA